MIGRGETGPASRFFFESAPPTPELRVISEKIFLGFRFALRGGNP